MSTAHAKYSPSSAHRWMECVGAPVMESEYPNESSIYADEGTAAHTLAGNLLLAGKDAKEFIGAPMAVMNDDGTVRSTFVVDEEFAMYVQVYLDYVRDAAKGRDLYVEQRLELSKVLGLPDQFGTGDALIADIERKHLHVTDLKFGMGEQVYAVDNHQMYLYGLGALETMDVIYGEDAFENLTVTVCQPRRDWIDEHTITVAELREFGARAKRAAGICESVKRDYTPATLAANWHAYLSPGDKTCLWCKAKASCPALAAKVSELAFQDFPAIIDDGAALAMGVQPQQACPDDLLGKRYSAVDLVSAWVTAVEAEVSRRVHAGAQIVNPQDGLPMKIVDGKKGNRAWDEQNIETVKGLLAARLTPDKMYAPQELLSPTKIQAALGVKPSKVEAKAPENNPKWKPLLPYIRQSPGSPKIALGSDPRPAITSTAPEATNDEFDAIDPLTA